MTEPLNAHVRAALRDYKRIKVAISSGSGSSGIKLLVGSVPQCESATSPGSNVHQHVPAKEAPRPRRLTRRELQILRLITQGFHNRQIASRIRRSIKTVEKHRQNLHIKLSTHEVAGLTRQALSMGLIDKPRRAQGKLSQRAKLLTPRELEILKLVAQGSGNKWIASELNRSIKTVDHHRENIMKKLDIHEVAGLTSYAVAIGLL